MSIEGFFSQKKIVICGVPQVSALESLLFLIYITDLTNPLEPIFHYLTNDTNLLSANKNHSVMIPVNPLSASVALIYFKGRNFREF